MKWQHLQNSYGVSSKHLDQTNVVINKSHKEKLISSTTTTTYNNKLQPISLLKRFQSLKWYRIKRIQFNKIRIVCNDEIILLFHIQCESIEYTAGAWQCQTIVCNRCRKKQNRQCDRSIYAWKWSFANFFSTSELCINCARSWAAALHNLRVYYWKCSNVVINNKINQKTDSLACMHTTIHIILTFMILTASTHLYIEAYNRTHNPSCTQ